MSTILIPMSIYIYAVSEIGLAGVNKLWPQTKSNTQHILYGPQAKNQFYIFRAL